MTLHDAPAPFAVLVLDYHCNPLIEGRVNAFPACAVAILGNSRLFAASADGVSCPVATVYDQSFRDDNALRCNCRSFKDDVRSLRPQCSGLRVGGSLIREDARPFRCVEHAHREDD